MSEDPKQLARLWLLEGKKVRDIADELGLSPSATYRRIKKHNFDGEQGNHKLYADLYRSTGDPDAAKLKPIKLNVEFREAGKDFGSADHVQIGWSDVHFPFEDEAAVEILYQITRDLQPDILTALGDIVDFWQLSDHRPPVEKNLKPHQITLQDTLEQATEHLGIMESLAHPGVDKYIAMGNHEDRWERMLAKIQNDPKLRQLMMIPKIAEVLNLDYLMGLKERGWKVTDYLGNDNTVLFDQLVSTHGHKSTKWASRAVMENYGKSVIFGHSHRIQNFTRNDLSGQIAGWNIGCLCDINPHWMVTSDWAQGFCVVTWKEVDGDWFFNVEQVRVHEGVSIFRDKVYKG